MYLTVATYEADGIQRDFAVPFTYIKKEYVKAYSEQLDSKGGVVGERQPLSFLWLNNGLIRLDVVVPTGNRITVERETFADKPLVDFQDAAIVTEQDLDLATQQSLHVAQEARDRNGYEILEASYNVMRALDEVHEFTERAEDAAADAEVSLQECEDHSASTERAKQDALAAKREAQELRDSIGADVELILDKVAQTTENTDTVIRLAGEVATNTDTVKNCTEEVQANTTRVEHWTADTSKANASALSAAERAEYAASLAESTAGIDFSIFVEKTDHAIDVDRLSLEIGKKANATEMEQALASKANDAHDHMQADVIGLGDALAEKANNTDLRAMAKIDDAPVNGLHYGRRSGSWAEIKSEPFPLMVGQATPYFGAVKDLTVFEPNFLYADGRAVSRTKYPELFAAYGLIYGAGDGSTTFNLPDLRGAFVRGLDKGRGLDAGRDLGTLQGDTIRDIIGTFEYYDGRYGAMPNVKVTGAFVKGATSPSSLNPSNGGAGNLVEFRASAAVPTSHENRPVNMACHWLIVARSPAMASPNDFTAAINAVNTGLVSKINEAPLGDKIFGRKNGTWKEVTEGLQLLAYGAITDSQTIDTAWPSLNLVSATSIGTGRTTCVFSGVDVSRAFVTYQSEGIVHVTTMRGSATSFTIRTVNSGGAWTNEFVQFLVYAFPNKG